MVCKAILTFLFIGALSVNVSAIPVPERAPLEGLWNKISPTSAPGGRPSTPNPPSEDHSRKDDAPAPAPPPKDDAPAKNSSDPEPGSGSKWKSIVQASIPMAVGSLFSGAGTRMMLDSGSSGSGNSGSSNSGSGNSGSSNPSPSNPGFSNPGFSNSGSANYSFTGPIFITPSPNTRRELALNPPPLYIAMRTLIDNHGRAPSDGPIRPKRESESESKDSDCVAPLPALKREPVSKDEVLDALSSLKRVPEPESLRCSRLSSHPHGQAPNIASRPRFKREPRTRGERGNHVGNYYANKYGSPDDVPGLAHY